MSVIAAYMVPHPPMIVPEIGRGSEEQVVKTIESYKEVAKDIAKLEPDTIIISSPHSIMYSDYFHISPGRAASGDFGDFGAPEVSFDEEYDDELVKRISDISGSKVFPAGTLGERDKRLDHGTMVPLYFIRQFYNGGKIVRLGLSGQPLTEHYSLGMIIQQAVDELGRKAVYVASGDLSHKLKDYGPYGFSKEGPVYDEKIMDVAGRAAFGEMLSFDDVLCEKAAECGHRSFVIMAGALDGINVEPRLLSHEDVTGVGYGVAMFHPEDGNSTGQKDDARRFLDIYNKDSEKAIKEKRKNADGYVMLAIRSIESYVTRGETMKVPNDVPDEIRNRRAGAFVSIHEDGALRGCIGTILPVRNDLAEEIINNAVSACSDDPRFDPVRPDELKKLDVSVDVLSEPEPIDDASMLDVKKYGVIVTNGGRRGLLLPDLDGVDTVEKQIAIAKSKAGIGPEEDVSLERFEVVRHH